MLDKVTLITFTSTNGIKLFHRDWFSRSKYSRFFCFKNRFIASEPYWNLKSTIIPKNLINEIEGWDATTNASYCYCKIND